MMSCLSKRRVGLLLLLFLVTLNCFLCFQYHHNTFATTRTIHNNINTRRIARTPLQQCYARVSKKGSLPKVSKTVDEVISPFDPRRSETISSTNDINSGKPLQLTEDNVEIVLDELRPALKSDGGDVKLVKIEDDIVFLELCGNCVSCASSSMTLSLGIEKTLRERIPSIKAVAQVKPDVPDITVENVEKVLTGVRPFLKIAGGTINVVKILQLGNGMPCVIVLKMGGDSKALHSVRLEIVQRIQKHFSQPMNIQWAD